MGRIVVTEFISLDGVIEAPGGGEGFKHDGSSFEINRGDEGDSSSSTRRWPRCSAARRRTYEGFAAAWPTGGRVRGQVQLDAQVLVTSTLDDPESNNSTVLKGDFAKEVAKLKQEHDGDIVVHGSAQLVQTLIDNDLVDELRLMVFPVVSAPASALRRDERQEALRLVDSRTSAMASRSSCTRRRRADPRSGDTARPGERAPASRRRTLGRPRPRHAAGRGWRRRISSPRRTPRALEGVASRSSRGRSASPGRRLRRPRDSSTLASLAVIEGLRTGAPRRVPAGLRRALARARVACRDVGRPRCRRALPRVPASPAARVDTATCPSSTL